MLHQILNLNVEIMRNVGLASSYVHLQQKPIAVLWGFVGQLRKKIRKLNILARVTHSPYESRICFPSSLHPSMSVIICLVWRN